MALLECMQAVQRALEAVRVVGLDGSTPTGPFLQYVTIGPREAVQGTPSAWLTNSSWNQPTESGSDREVTDWVIVARIFQTYVTDEQLAELLLASCIEPIREAFRAAIKMRDASGNPLVSVERALVKQGEWGYMGVNDIEYRYVDLSIMVREKVTVQYSA